MHTADMLDSNESSEKFQLEDNRNAAGSRFQDIIRPSGPPAAVLSFSDSQCSGSSQTLEPQYFRCHRHRLIWRRATAAERLNVAEEYAQWVPDAPELAPAHRQIDG
jgi:hypothetical protein